MRYRSSGSFIPPSYPKPPPHPYGQQGGLTINQDQRVLDLERKVIELQNENLILRNAILECIEENAHLADGENCTLISLKRAIGNLK